MTAAVNMNVVIRITIYVCKGRIETQVLPLFSGFISLGGEFIYVSSYPRKLLSREDTLVFFLPQHNTPV